jgi:hypothetical protein
METYRPKERTVHTVEIYRVKNDPANDDRVLEIRGAAVAEFQEQVPELVRADLVRLEDDVWLDILAWSGPVDSDRIDAAAQCSPTSAAMHSLIAAEIGHDRGELVHTAGTLWATAR